MMSNKPSHPYEAYEGTQLWHAVDKAIAELVANNDLTELTLRQYIVGLICDRVAGSIKKEHP